ncbi:MAG: gas vesicle protein, partial [Microcystis panniformis]
KQLKEDLSQFQEQRLAAAKQLENDLRQQHLDRAKQLKEDLSQFQERRLAEAKQLKDELRQFRQDLSIYVFGK